MDEVVAVRVANLTDSQRRILRLAAGGVTTAEIATRLALSPDDVARELAAVLALLGVRTTREASLVWWGSRAGARPDLAMTAQTLVD